MLTVNSVTRFVSNDSFLNFNGVFYAVSSVLNNSRLHVITLRSCCSVPSHRRQEIWANAHEMRDSISLISYAGCLGLSAVYFSENSL